MIRLRSLTLEHFIHAENQKNTPRMTRRKLRLKKVNIPHIIRLKNFSKRAMYKYEYNY